ncbi:site-specific integrase [Pseudomonas sp. Irchel s3b5]|uniref:tyrosine-type recombinase/integrase n=1 Tax=Pseudomonas sp. Irchel s3b5 TaxID=2009077 RepID=UPI002113FF33|nr:site-specific integrase [Pseudomonas sp. Irchel s3b5]
MMNHAELLETTRNGKLTYRLLCTDSAMAEFFDGWAYQLTKKKKANTVKSYCYSAKDIVNFVHTVGFQNGGLTPELMNEALDSYESFLVFGVQSESFIAREAAKILGSKNFSGASVETHFAGVNNFLAASEAMRDGLLQMQRSGYISVLNISAQPLPASTHVQAPGNIKSAIKANSWLAGCLAGGAKKIKRTNISAVSKASTLAHTDEFGGDEKAFPIDKCKALIESTDCLRDKVLWSLVAASGCRISEALTVLKDDLVIDPDMPQNNKFLIIDPDSRRNILIKYISEKKLNKLEHKGRDTPDTFLIEPFASMFWYYLDLYIEEEKAKEKACHRPVTHRFLFRNLRSGAPIPSSYQTVWERFNKAARLITGESYGFHSLRHMYAYYLVNHCPSPGRNKQFGLELKLVQKLLGHKSIKSTERYARKDAKMLEATFAAINMIRMSTPNYSLAKVQIQHLENELEQLKLSLSKGVASD